MKEVIVQLVLFFLSLEDFSYYRTYGNGLQSLVTKGVCDN